MEDASFIELVRSEMRDIGNRRGIAIDGDQFAIWFATRILLEDEGKVADEYHIGGTGDDKIDLGICDDSHQIVLIAQCKFTDSPLGNPFNKDLIDETLAANNRMRTSPTTGNNERKTFVQAANASPDKPHRLLAVGFGRFKEPESHQYAIDNGVEVYDYDKMKDRYLYLHVSGAIREPDLLEFTLPRTRSRRSTGNSHLVDVSTEQGPRFRVYSFFADVKDIYEAVKQYRDGLFHENLRYRLTGSSKGKIGQEIMKTVVDHPETLSVLNNGLSMVCSDATVTTGRITVHRPQVVNGCQTCWAIYEACGSLIEAGRYDQLHASVQLRVVKTIDDTLKDSVTKATNRQNPIVSRDEHSADTTQRGLRHAFDQNAPQVLWDHREGLKESLRRENALSLYHIAQGRNRAINNEFAGQLYLALLGKPHLCKDQKKYVFQDPEFYRTIYCYDQAAPIRFRNDQIGIEPSQVLLRTGQVQYFVEDILFAYGVYQLAEAYKDLYRKKLALFGAGQQTSSTYGNLKTHEFVATWHFYVVAAMNYLVERLDQTHRSTLRQQLVGVDINKLWAANLSTSFNLNSDLTSYLILDETNPSTEYPKFGKWLISLTQLMFELANTATGRSDWKSFRTYLDQRSETYVELRNKIDEKLGGPIQVRRDWFPLT